MARLSEFDGSRRAKSGGIFEAIGSIVFIATIAFLAFVGGAYVVLSSTFPSTFLTDAYRAFDSLRVQREIIKHPVRTNLWQPARTQARGVTVFDRTRVTHGYTLYTSGDDNVARLISLDGRVIHEWRRPYSTVWNESAAHSRPHPDSLIYMDKARMLPNGDLIAIYISAADTPWGYGMVKLDKDSNLVWSYLAATHHDFDIAPNGNILVLTHEFNFNKPPEAGQLSRPWLEDFLVELAPDGRELRKLSLTRAVLDSRFRTLFQVLPYYALGDPLHTNTVKYVTEQQARNFPFADPGDALVNFRDLGLVAVLSMKTGGIRWGARGPWLGQHDPSILANGNILLFDNLGGYDGNNSSRVIEVDPSTLAVTWQYTGSRDHPLFSGIRSSAERLADGNTLINESDGGRLLEVTQTGEIVWEYVNPARGGENDELIAVVSSGQRIDPNWLDFAFHRELSEHQQAAR